MPSPEDVIKEMLRYLLDPSDSDRAFVTFNPNDNVVMLVNNFGGLSNLEFDAMVNLALIALKRDWKIVPTRIYAGVLETSLNAQGFSITLGNMSGMAKAMDLKDEDVMELLDAPTTLRHGQRTVTNLSTSIRKQRSYATKPTLLQPTNPRSTRDPLHHPLSSPLSAQRAKQR